MLKKCLNLLVGFFFLIGAVLLGIASFSLVVILTNAYIAVTLSILIVAITTFYLNKLRKKLFKLKPSRKPYNVVLTTALFGIAMVYIFLIPTKTFVSTGTVVEKYGLTPELIHIHTGDKIAVYVDKPKVSNGQDPILFVSGGPGAYPKKTKDYLHEYVKRGYTVYTYDPIGSRESPKPKKVSAYSIKHEVGVVGDILRHYKINKVNLIASSYGGNVSARFIEAHPKQVNAYLAIDTAALYTLPENYPGQLKDKAFQKTVEDTREDLSKEKNDISPLKSLSIKQIVRVGYGIFLTEVLKLDDIPYGSYEEYDYAFSTFVSNELDSSGNKKVTDDLNYIANRKINRSLENSPDFTKNLKQKETPPMLAVHPEFGIVGWQTHWQYKDYFKKIKFLTVPGAGHATWMTKKGEELLVRNGDSLFRGQPITDEYTSSKNPFPPIKN